MVVILGTDVHKGSHTTLAVARAALREPTLPVAQHDQVSWAVKLLVDHREHLVAERTRTINRLR